MDKRDIFYIFYSPLYSIFVFMFFRFEFLFPTKTLTGILMRQVVDSEAWLARYVQNFLVGREVCGVVVAVASPGREL